MFVREAYNVGQFRWQRSYWTWGCGYSKWGVPDLDVPVWAKGNLRPIRLSACCCAFMTSIDWSDMVSGYRVTSSILGCEADERHAGRLAIPAMRCSSACPSSPIFIPSYVRPVNLLQAVQYALRGWAHALALFFHAESHRQWVWWAVWSTVIGGSSFLWYRAIHHPPLGSGLAHCLLAELAGQS